MLALSVGAGLAVGSPAVVRNARLRAATLGALLIAFVAWRIGALAAGPGLTLAGIVQVAVQALVVGSVYALAYAHAHGLAQVAALFRGGDAGYAMVLDEGSAARKVEAELARSRRHGAPLTFLLLEPTVGSAGPAFEAVMRRLSPRALAEVERLYVQQHSCRLIAEQVRRSDVVVCSTEERFLVLNTDTDAAGAAVLAERLVDAVESELGIRLRLGIAEFPEDGSTYTDLLAAATSASAENAEPAPWLHSVAPTVALDEPTLTRVEANP